MESFNGSLGPFRRVRVRFMVAQGNPAECSLNDPGRESLPGVEETRMNRDERDAERQLRWVLEGKLDRTTDNSEFALLDHLGAALRDAWKVGGDPEAAVSRVAASMAEYEKRFETRLREGPWSERLVEITAQPEGSLVALAESRRNVYVFDLDLGVWTGAFTTNLDTGGCRTALDPAGRLLVTANFYGGIEARHLSDGQVAWTRNLSKVQHLSFVPGCRALAVTRADRSTGKILDADTGTTRGRHPVEDAWWSLDGHWMATHSYLRPLSMQDLRTGHETRFSGDYLEPIGGAFGADLLLLGSGVLRCLDPASGLQHWQQDVVEGKHYVEIAWCASDHCWYGYLRENSDRNGRDLLTRIHPDGSVEVVCEMERLIAAAFCKSGTRFVGNDGRVLDTRSGEAVAYLFDNDPPAPVN